MSAYKRSLEDRISSAVITIRNRHPQSYIDISVTHHLWNLYHTGVYDLLSSILDEIESDESEAA